MTTKKADFRIHPFTGKRVDINKIPDATFRSKKASAFWEMAQDVMLVLYNRWLDERDYEDIKDYQTPGVKSIAKKCKVVILKMTAKPFGCEFTCDDCVYRLEVKGSTYSYRRVA